MRIGALLLLFSCASSGSNSPYKFYGLDVHEMTPEERAHGKLRAKDPKDDLDLNACMPTIEKPNPCVTQFSSDYFKLIRDLEECRAGN